MGRESAEFPLLGSNVSSSNEEKKKIWRSRALCFFLGLLILSSLTVKFGGDLTSWLLKNGNTHDEWLKVNEAEIIQSEQGVVAADDGRCSEIGASMLREGGHAVDAAVATALCVGVINAQASGIGGGAFMVVRSSSTLKTQAFDMRETAPLAASKNMYANNIEDKYSGPLSIGVPGEIAGLHEAWLQHGRLPWRNLFQPAIKLAKYGFIIRPYLGLEISKQAGLIMNDPGLQEVFAPNGNLLQAGDKCFNMKLARSLEAIAEQGPQAFYNGTVGEQLVKDVRKAGGILTMEDLQNYKVEITDAVTANVMGYTVHGMPPPSGGTLGLSMVLNIFDSYGTSGAVQENLGLHRLIEALKHMFAVRMNLGDPKFVDIKKYVAEMLSPTYAEQIRKRIIDNTTFPPEYYMNRWSQLRDHGTSHFCIVDAERNAVSMTTTVNYPFGAGLLSPSTGIVLNNEMGDFSVPTEITPDVLPPAPSNFIESNKRPLSSMTPIVVTKDDQVVGVLGGSGGMDIIPAVAQVFINHFVLGLEPLIAVEKPRIYHRLIPNIVKYENWTVIDGDHIELAEETKLFLKERGHELEAKAGGAIVQLVVQTLQNPIKIGRKSERDSQNAQILRGELTAVSDPRKDGRPAAV
ncbi:glutathione hydrolase 3 [Ricinus communis]|uniref:Glutathione hydrolase n=1 Tax=Ricinus communis TaxID=3988 RepID=B9RKE3_RICCO|nr:glutathione hydrolase 3 [Ricinus communis]EEF48141.1 gamma glutamyl transpeptidases, putative [Ricinus communis]|eukprot:XP_002514187.1 glutathione hydrolase 3 [Ricinus communis]